MRPRPRPRRPARAAPVVRSAAAAPEAAARTGIAGDVEAELRRHGYDPVDPGVVDTLAAVGAGYRQGPAVDPPYPFSFDTDAAVAREIVDRFAEGDRPSDLNRRMHRLTTRATVEINVAQLPFAAPVGETAIATLTSLCLGSWDPGRDEVAKRNAYASFMVRWYRDGLP